MKRDPGRSREAAPGPPGPKSGQPEPRGIPPAAMLELWLLRHGATAWARDGRHTGRTDIPLLPEGEEQARCVGPLLHQLGDGGGHPFAAVLASPLQRAWRTAELAGLGAQAQPCDDLLEWDYGAYEGIAEPADAAWALQVLLGKQGKRLITGRRLRQICLEGTPLPDWLFDDCYAHVGDSAETIALLWQQVAPGADSAGGEPGHRTAAALDGAAAARRRRPGRRATRPKRVRRLWQGLNPAELLVANKLLTGGLRVGVGQGLVLRALAQLSGLEEALLQHRLMGGFRPSAAAYQALLAPAGQQEACAQPALPLLSGLPFGAEAGPEGDDGSDGPLPGPASGLAGGVEVRRHPRPADPPRWPELPLEPRRGADQRRLPRADQRRQPPCRRHRARRRDSGVATRAPGSRRPSPSCSAAWAARPLAPPAAGRVSGGVRGLRPARAGGRGPAPLAPEPAPRRPGVPDPGSRRRRPPPRCRAPAPLPPPAPARPGSSWSRCASRPPHAAAEG
jgi:hypothetical protein